MDTIKSLYYGHSLSLHWIWREQEEPLPLDGKQVGCIPSHNDANAPLCLCQKKEILSGIISWENRRMDCMHQEKSWRRSAPVIFWSVATLSPNLMCLPSTCRPWCEACPYAWRINSYSTFKHERKTSLSVCFLCGWCLILMSRGAGMTLSCHCFIRLTPFPTPQKNSLPSLLLFRLR